MTYERKTPPPPPNPWELSAVQCQVLELLAVGWSLKSVATITSRCASAVAQQLRRAKTQMGAKTTINAVIIWDRHTRANQA